MYSSLSQDREIEIQNRSRTRVFLLRKTDHENPQYDKLTKLIYHIVSKRFDILYIVNAYIGTFGLFRELLFLSFFF